MTIVGIPEGKIQPTENPPMDCPVGTTVHYDPNDTHQPLRIEEDEDYKDHQVNSNTTRDLEDSLRRTQLADAKEMARKFKEYEAELGIDLSCSELIILGKRHYKNQQRVESDKTLYSPTAARIIKDGKQYDIYYINGKWVRPEDEVKLSS